MDNLGISDFPIDERYSCDQSSDRHNNHTNTSLSFIFALILTLSYLTCNISILRFYFHILNVINYVFHNIMGVWVVQWLRSMTSDHRHSNVKLKWVRTIALFGHKPSKYESCNHTRKTSNQNVVSNKIHHSDWTIVEYEYKLLKVYEHTVGYPYQSLMLSDRHPWLRTGFYR